MIRFSRKLQDELSKIKDPCESLKRLIDIYLGGTCIEHCAALFCNTEQEIIDVLIDHGVYEHKKCSKCKIIKPFEKFYTNSSMGKNTNRSGVSCQCRDCNSENGKNYFNNNREHKRKYDREYKQQPHILKDRLEYQKEFFKDPENKKKRAKRANERYHNNIEQKLHTIVSVCINKCLNHNKLGISINKILDYTIDDLKLHLESKFDDKMNWENYGSYWEIDHIVPLSAFKITSYEDESFKNCWSLKNLRPLQHSVNSSKKDQINEQWGNVELAAQFGII